MTLRDEPRRSVGDAKAHFAECIRQAERGQSMVLTRHGRPVARLVPLEEAEGDVGGQRADRWESAGEVRERRVDEVKRSADSFRTAAARRAALERLLVQEIWPLIPQRLLGKGVSKREREEILGYGEDGT